MNYTFLNDILVLFAAAVVVVVLFLRFRLPPILGYLSVGVLMGPYGLAWVTDTEHTRGFAEFGIVFLLFTIGLEFSLPLLMRMKGAVLGLGGFQVLITTALTAVIARFFGLPLESALVLGGVVTMSSTALVIKQLADQVELHTRHGRNAVGILLFQDVAVIPFLILVASLGAGAAVEVMPASAIAIAIFKGLLALVVILSLGRWVLRPMFRAIARFRSTELFTLAALLVTLSAAALTHEMGLSLALGAFLAGMMLGETEFRHQIEAEIRPFRDVLLGLFFITIGMLLNVHLLPTLWPWVLLLLAGLILFKLILIAVLCRLAGWDNAVSLRTGLVLAHGGEFGFALLALTFTKELFPTDFGQAILAALLFSMGLAPLIIRSNRKLTSTLLPKDTLQSQKTIEEQIANTAFGRSHHVIICGYGRVGQNVAHLLETEFIDYVALDLDPVLVQNAIKAKEPVSYGDSANIHLLEAAGLSRAAALVISLNEYSTALKILHRVRAVNAEIPILVRAADDAHLAELQEAGATEVVPETLEASLMLSSHLLLTLKVPPMMVFARIRQVREERYALLRQTFPGEQTFAEHEHGTGMQLRAVELAQSVWAVNKRIADLRLGEMHVSVTAIQRQKERLTHPEQDTLILAGDTLILFGTSNHLDQAESLILRPASTQ